MFQLTPPPYWRAERTRRRQIQYKEQNLDRVGYAEDAFTGSSGGTIYDGDAFPPEYHGNVFTGDVAGNLVHRDVLVPSKDSPVLIAKRDPAETKGEFLASHDSWFRPAGFTVGPDGFLYVIDMYRQHIETPLSIPEDLKEDMDFMYGSEHGRIYRILPESHAGKKHEAPNLKNATSEELVKTLAHPNRWWRLQAQRLLLERQDQGVIKPVEELFQGHQDPRTRLHALYVLEGLNALNAKTVERALDDSHEGVRKHGLILAERFPELLPRIINLMKDSSLQVVLQASLSAGEFNGPKVVEALAAVAQKYGSDRWMRTAVLSSEAGTSVELLSALAKNSFFDEAQPWKAAFIEEFAYAAASGKSSSEINRLITLLNKEAKDEQSQIAAAKGLINGLPKNQQATNDVKEWVKTVKVSNGEESKAALAELSGFYKQL
jgi:hypothetical protein